MLCYANTCFVMQTLVMQTLVMLCKRSCTDHLLRAQIQPKPLPKHCLTSFVQLMHNGIRELQVWQFAWTRPRGLLGVIPCISMTKHPDPTLYLNHPKRVPINWAWAADSKHMLIICWKNISEDPPQIFLTTPNDYPPADPSELTHLYTNR